MGITVGIAMLAGLVIAWGVLVPVLTAMQPVGADRPRPTALARLEQPGALHRRRRDRRRRDL